MSASVYDILLLVTALSVDAFAACFIYGADRVKIPLLSACIITGVSSAVLLAFLLGTLGFSVLLRTQYNFTLLLLALYILLYLVLKRRESLC